MNATGTSAAADERPRFSGEWATKRLGELANIKTGSRDNQDKVADGPYPFFVRSETVERIDSYSYDEEAVLIPGEGGIGSIFHYIVGKFEVHQRVYRISRFSDDVVGRYVFLQMRFRFGRHAMANTVKATVDSLRLPTFKVFELPLPSPPEQRAIAAALSDVDGLLQSLGRLIAKKREVKQGAMQQLLAGTTRLPGFEGAWELHKVGDLIHRYFCGPSPTCEERNVSGTEEWGVLKTTCATYEHGWDESKHKVLPRSYWPMPHIELRCGDVIVTKAGPRHRVGVPVHVDHVRPRIVPSGKMIALRPLENRVVPMMLALSLRAARSQTYLDHRTTGMAESQVNFENEALVQAPVVLPTLPEQRAIAAVLSDMDSEIDALEVRRDKVAAIKQGMMQELLTGSTRLPIPEEAIDA